MTELIEMTTWTDGCRLPQIGDESIYEGYDTIIKQVEVLGPTEWQHPHQGETLDISITHEVQGPCEIQQTIGV
jgi:hypothetical protein